MTLAFFSVMTLGILVNWIAGALLAFTIFFYVVIYTMRAEALDRAEHRDRRRRRRAAAGGGVGRGDRLAVGRAAAAVPDHLLLDPAAFLGAGAVPLRRLCPRRRADAAGGRRSRCDAAADPALYDRAGRGRGRALAARLFRRGLWRDLARSGRRHAGARGQRLSPPRAGAKRCAPRESCSPSRSFICLRCLRPC